MSETVPSELHAPPETLCSLEPGMPVPYGGDRVTRVPAEIAARFRAGDRLLVVQSSGELLHVPREQQEVAEAAVTRACAAFARLGELPDARITRFYEEFAARLTEERVWSGIAAANAADVERARARGRSTTRLVTDAKMRAGMIQGLRDWRDAPSLRGRVMERIDHEGWSVEQVLAGLGVVGFVFEGRPNVFADGTGVLRSGNTAVMRIGGDALGTARAIVRAALDPALEAAGLPEGAVTLIESAEHAAGWALFSDSRLGLAVARGSGPTADLLGSIARQSGVPISLHGTGGAWIVADASADAQKLRAAVYHSTDRKVCNTLNTLLVPAARAGELVPLALDALRERGERLGHGFKLHVAAGSESHVPPGLFHTTARMLRAQGEVEEPIAETLPEDQLGREWEWEGTPEVTLRVVRDSGEAVALFNAQSPQFIASLIAEAPEAHAWFFAAINAPFVGNGFTRWVDGQYTLNRPELGLSNWQYGRLFGRGGILTGDGVYTIRYRARQTDFGVHR
jgi:glutamate-5-semialdehyde dehydrogenase